MLHSLPLRSLPSRKGFTLASVLHFEGIGLMSGETVALSLFPLKDAAGYRWRFKGEESWQSLNEGDVLDAAGRTTLLRIARDDRSSQGVMVVEHLLSALKGMGIDHVGIEVMGKEIPILDGSALPFAEAIAKVGRQETDSEVNRWELTEPFVFESGETSYALSPSSVNQLSFHCVVDYPHTPAIGLQKFDFTLELDDYLEQLSKARTFCLVEELEFLRAKGLIRGGSLDCALVFEKTKALNPEGTRYIDEPARHKLLDLIGDLALLGFDLSAHITAIKPSHRANNELAKILRTKLP